MERDSRKRAEALLAQMTATEKVGQLNQHLYGFRIYQEALTTPSGLLSIR